MGVAEIVVEIADGTWAGFVDGMENGNGEGVEVGGCIAVAIVVCELIPS